MMILIKNAFSAKNKKYMIYVTIVFMCLYMMIGSAIASGGEAEFGDIYQKLTDWSQGTLGKLLALICVVVGMAITVARGSLIWAVISIGMCIILYNAPTIIDSLMDVAIAPQQILDIKQVTITNGLN